jgi:hypothetical protein
VEGESHMSAPRHTHCRNGHEYTPENSYMNPHNSGRTCRICQRTRENARNLARREARRQESRVRPVFTKVIHETPKSAPKTRTHSGSGVIAGRIVSPYRGYANWWSKSYEAD